MMSGIGIGDLDVFGHGLFQDILTLMKTLDTEELTKKDVTRYRDMLLKNSIPIVSNRSTSKRKPCKGCKDKNR